MAPRWSQDDAKIAQEGAKIVPDTSLAGGLPLRVSHKFCLCWTPLFGGLLVYLRAACRSALGFVRHNPCNLSLFLSIVTVAVYILHGAASGWSSAPPFE